MVFFRRDDDEEEIEAPEDEDATLADDVLDEVEGEGDELAVDDTIEGFGLVTEEEEEEEEEDGDDAEKLEEDAEEVDFDTFDDVDEM